MSILMVLGGAKIDQYLKCNSTTRFADFFLWPDYPPFILCRLKPCTLGRCGLKGLSNG